MTTPMNQFKRIVLSIAGILFVTQGTATFSQSFSEKPSDELFGIAKLWDIHLRFTADQWKSIEPSGMGGFPGGPPMGGDRPRGDRNSEPRTRDGNQRDGDRAERRMGPPGGPFGGMEFPYVKADFEFGGQTFKDVGVRFKGQASFRTSQNSRKKSFKIDFDRNDKTQQFFQMKKLSLNNNIMDPSQMLDSLGYETFREFGIAAPRTAYARVYLTVDGETEKEYLGLYTLVEQIDEIFLERNFGHKKGLLLKPQMIQGLPYFGRNWEDYEQPYEPKSEDVTWKQAKRFMDFTELVNNATDSVFVQEVGQYTDIDQFLRFLAVNVTIANYDSILGMGQNYYIYGEPDQKKYLWIPWDLNMGFGMFMMAGSSTEQIQASISEPLATTQPLIERVLAVPEWKEKYLGFIREFTARAFQPERIKKNIEAIHAAIDQAVKDDPNASYESFLRSASDETLASNPNRPSFSPGSPDQGRREFRGGPPMMMGAYSLSTWVQSRYDSVQMQLEGKSEGVKMGRGGFGPGRGPGGPGGFGPGGPGGPGGFGPGGPGGPGGFGPGGPEDFGPGMFLAPQLMHEMDSDQDGKITTPESEKQVNEWASAWDTNHDRILTEKELSDGLGKLFPVPEEMQNFGPPGGFAPSMLWIRPFQEKADANGDLPQTNFVNLWKEWFQSWDTDQSGDLIQDEMKKGINQFSGPPPGMMDAPPGF